MEHVVSLLDQGFHAEQIVARSSRRGLTAEVLAERCREVAEQLCGRGISTLALHGDNSLEWLIVDLACQLAGVCLVPLPTFFSERQLLHVFRTVPVDAVFCEQAELFLGLLSGRVLQQSEELVADYHVLSLCPATYQDVLPPGSDKVTFTSGSTGSPKGVCLGTAQLIKQARALSGAVGLQRPRHLCLLPLSTLLENVAGLYTPLLSGGELIIPSLAEIGFTGSSSLDHHAFLAIISKYRPDSIILTPQLLTVLVAAADSGWQAPESLKFVAVGGGRVSTSLMESAHKHAIPAYEGYGLSECASVVSLNTPGDHDHRRSGRPLAHLDVRIEDGEVVISGNAMLGYVGEPDSWGQISIHSGDLGSIDEQGFLSIEGRKKNVLISSFGRNINPEWVESELLAQPVLSECVVFGEARPYCVALLSPRDAQASDESIQLLVDHGNARLPDYAQVKHWHRLPRPLAAMENMLTENGRPKRQQIEACFRPVIESLYPDSLRA